jgi:glycosyltransferase involved in cell wall biosynthesis
VTEAVDVRTARLQVPEHRAARSREFTCSVIIPCYNEAENIAAAIRRVPQLGTRTEVIVVDDGSTDGTSDAVRAVGAQLQNVQLIAYTPNRGKGYAVRRGFEAGRGEIVVILDADMSVAPEELPRFIEPLMNGNARVVNGTRMSYPMEPGAMSPLHRLGNRVFSRILSWMIGQSLTDTLCGTKGLVREDALRIPMRDAAWGDFDLLCGAAALGLRIVEVPVHYRRRAAGQSKMKLFRHGVRLLAVCAQWFIQLKLVHRHVAR